MTDDVFAALRGIHANTEALKRDLAERVAHWDRPGYYYRGSADLLLQHGTFFKGRELPDKYLDVQGPEGECFSNALRAVGVHPELRYFEGVYAAHGTFTSHGWCVDPDGLVVETTWVTRAEERERYHDGTAGMKIIHPERMAYCGVELHPDLVLWFADTYDELCIFDRPPGDALTRPDMDMSQDHDFDILRVPYDPARTTLPRASTP